MFQVENVEQWKGQPVLDADGEKVGKLDDVLFDVRTNQPTLAAVKVGRLSKSTVLVPLADATMGRDHVRLPHAKDVLESAPHLDGHVSREDELLVGRHFGLTVPEAEDTDDDRPLYQTSSEIVAQRKAADEALARAAALEAEAERKQGIVVEGQTHAALATERADAAEDERRRLLAEAEELRRSAGTDGP